MSLAIVAAFGVVPVRPVYALSTKQQAIRDGLVTVSDALAGLDSLDELASALPLSDLLPTSPAGLDVVNAVKKVLDDALDLVGDGALESEFESAINGLNGDDIGGGVIAHVNADVSDSGITFTELRFTKAGPTDLDFTVPQFSLDGTSIAFTLELDFTANGDFVVSLDTAPTPFEIYLAEATPDAELSASLSLDVDPGVTLDLGILTVEATGYPAPAAPATPDIASSVTFAIDWLDPDGNGRIDVGDLTTAAPLDLFDVSYAASSVDLALTLTAASDLLPGLTATGSVQLHDSDLGDGLDDPLVMLPELENFTNMTPEEILTSIAHLAVSLQAMQTRVANIDLPMLGADPNVAEGDKTVENLADLLDVNSAIGDWFVSLGLSTAESPFELRIGDIDGNGTVDNGLNGTTDLGERTLEQLGLDNIDAIIAELSSALGDAADLDYDAATDALTFDLTFHGTYAPPGAIVAINDQLDALGLKGLVTANGATGIHFTSSYDVSVGFGIDLSPDGLFPGHSTADPPPLTDRLFIETTGTEIAGDAFVCADVSLVGTLGFLELSLADNDADGADFCDTPGEVPLLNRRASDTGTPMVRVDLDGGSDGMITLTDLFDQLGSLTASDLPNGFRLTSGDAITLTGTINAGVPTTRLDASATIGDDQLGDAGSLGSAWIEFGWPDLFGPPSVTGGGDFDNQFLVFNIDDENPLALFNSIIDLVDQAVAMFDTLDSGNSSSLLDEDLPVIGTSFRDSLEFLNEVRDTINSIASDPAGSLQKLETQLEIAIAQGLGVDLSTVGELPDPNDPIYVKPGPDGSLGTADDFFDDAEFQAELNGYYTALENFFTGQFDFVDLGYATSSPGAVTLSIKLGVCSPDPTTGAPAYPGCSKAIPLTKAFNFNLDQLGAGFAGLVAAETAGELTLDYNASFQLDLGVQLPDVANSQFVPQPFILDSSFIDLRIAGLADAAFSASIGPFEVAVGNLTPVGESGTACDNDVDDDGDDVVNDGCPQVGDVSEASITGACADAVDSDLDGEDPDDGKTNDGCPPVAAGVRAAAGAQFHLQADHGTTGTSRVYLGDLGTYAGNLVSAIPGSFATNPAVTCPGFTDVYMCAALPVFVNAGGDDIYLGTIDGSVTQIAPSFQHTFSSTDIDAIAQALIDNADTLAFQLIGQGLQAFGTYLAEATSAASYDVNIPVIGDLLDGGADVAKLFNEGFAQPFGGYLGGFDPSDTAQVESDLANQIFTLLNGTGLLLDTDGNGSVDADDVSVVALCGDPAAPCVSGTDEVYDISDLSVTVKIGKTLFEADDLDFDFGFPGLRLATKDGGGVSSSGEWSITLGFGLSRTEGFYLVNGAGNEISVGADLNVGGLEADIAFLGVDVDADYTDGKDPARVGKPELFVDLGISLGPDSDPKVSLSDLANIDPKEFLPTLTAGVDLYWRLATAPEFGGTSAGDGTMPTVYATLNVAAQAQLSIDGLDFSGPGGSGDMVFQFDDIELDLGSFIDDFLGPILAEVQNFTKPLQPVIDVVTAPIPGISQLAELVGEPPVTMLVLFEAISGNDLTLIKTLLDVITFVNAIPTDTSSIGNIPIGRFTVYADKILDTELPSNQKGELINFESPLTQSTPGGISGAIGGLNSTFDGFKAAFVKNTRKTTDPDYTPEKAGLTFPAFEDFSSLFNLLVGQDVTLVRFASGPLKAEFGFSQSFGPIAVGPIPVSIVISGSASIEGRFAVGYDTKGIRQLVKAIVDDEPGLDALSGFGMLFNGLFLDDLNAAGQDVPEIRLVVEFAAGAAVDLVIVSAGVEGGVRATIDMNLHDGGFFNPIPPENLDGKLRLDEIASFLLLNPICLFDVSGKLEAFIRIFVEIDLFLFSARFEFTVVNITLLELDNITASLCEPPPPVLAKDIGSGVLRLNMGPNAGDRNYAPDTLNEKFTVRIVAPNAVEVSAFGLVQSWGPNEAGKPPKYDNNMTVTKVVADGGTGKDTIRFDPGSDEIVATGDIPETTDVVEQAGDIVSVPIPFDIPTIVCGGPNDDKVFGGDAVDRVIGDGAQNQKTPGAGWDCSTTEDNTGSDPDGNDRDGNDEVSGLGGDDVFYGLGGADVLIGDSGNDYLNGGSGDDTLNGGIGGDEIRGGADNDNIKGGADRDPALPEVPDDESNDRIWGDGGIDTIDADYGDDEVHGGTENDVIVAGPGIDTVHGDEHEDQIFGNDGDDDLYGDAGDDVIYGMRGNDDIRGGDGDDNLLGNEGDDDIEGGDGKDVILGDMGVVNRAQNPGESTLDPDPGKQLVELEAYPSGEPSDPGDTVLSGDGDTDVIYGQEGDDTIEGGAGNDELHGNAGIDTMSGDADADTMFGDSGPDTMYGDNAAASNACADGVDTMKGGDGDDTMSGNAQGDNMFGDNGDDLMFGDANTPNPACDGDDTMYGGPLDDYQFGNNQNDTMFGQGGQDRLVGGSDELGPISGLDGSDTILGGTGDDTIAGDNATMVNTGGKPVLQANLNITTFLDGQGTGDFLYGEDGTDWIFGQEGDDDISGGNHQDFLEGNDDTDTIDGDGGDDRIAGGSSQRSTIDDGSDVVPYDEAPDVGDVLNGNGGDDVMAGDNAHIAADGGTTMTTENGSGISGDDVMHGNDGQDRMYGQLGSDDMWGDDDEDYLVGDLGDIAAAKSPTLPMWPGGAPNYDVSLDLGPEVVADDDTPVAPDTPGGDAMYGGADDDHMFGGVGDDLMQGDADDDYMEGNNGDDAMFGNAADLELGNDEDDMIGGSSSWTRQTAPRLDGGENLMQGNGDHDVMLGDNGDIDRIVDGSEWAEDEVVEGARKRVVTLLDRDKTLAELLPVSGGDRMQGNDGSDRMYGEGGSDLVQGNDDDDFLQGNQSGDWLEGNSGEDDIIGGSSFLASDGGLPEVDVATDPDDLGDPDGDDAIFGGGDADVIAGDNAVIIRNTTGNADNYDAALAGAYFTTDHTDDAPGWWLGVSTDRLVILLDREEETATRFGDDVISGGSGEDVAFGQDGDDWVGGGQDDDTVEGNGGNDRIYGDLAPYQPGGVPTPGTEGNSAWADTGHVSAGVDRDGPITADGEDDLVGGSNVTHRDGDDDIQGDGEDDFILGDNGTLQRWIIDDTYQDHLGDGAKERIFRTATQLDPGTAGAGNFGDDALDGNGGDDAIWGQDGDDLLRGQADDDDLIGELGDDTIYGGTGEDAMVGDRGSILNSALGDPDALFESADVVEDYSGPPFLTGVRYFTTGRFDRRVDLAVDVAGSVGGPFPGEATGTLVAPGILQGGDDRMRGGPDHDSMHGAWGDDLMNGDQGGDWLFGSHGSDVMWGGFGAADGSPTLGIDYVFVDRLFGGRGGDPSNDTGVITGGADILDFRPREASETPDGVADPDSWFEMTGAYSDADNPADTSGGSPVAQDHEGTDWIYGGYDRDVMQGDVTDPGPNAGDRMWDWTGAFNLYTHCDPDYGGYNDQRARSPQMELFIEKLAFDSGVGSSLSDVQTSISSAYRELALVYKFDTKDNNGKAYPTTPGHFDVIAECDLPPDTP